MPSYQQHLDQATENERLARELSARDGDWVVTLLFYAAVHYVEAYFATGNDPGLPQHYFTHEDRNRAVWSRLNAIYSEFNDLYNDSRDARYNCRDFQDYELQRCHARLELIKGYLIHQKGLAL